MTTTAWAHLPNAPHIDRILAHCKAHPDRWDAALDAAWYAAWDAAWGANSSATWDAARYAAGGTQDITLVSVRIAIWAAIIVLIAYGDCAGILDMPVDEVRTLAANGHQPAILLLPAVLAMEEK